MNISHNIFNSLSFYKKWLSVTLIVFVLFGSIPLTIIIFKKIRLIPLLNQHLYDLNTRNEYVDRTYADVNELPDALLLLDKNQFENFDLHHYMVPLFSACTRSGFEVDSFNPSKLESQMGYSINLRVWGVGRVARLVEQIESLEVATTVESVSVSTDKERSTVILNISVLNPEVL